MSVIVAISMSTELFEKIERLREQANEKDTAIIFKRSPFYVKVLQKGLENYK